VLNLPAGATVTSTEVYVIDNGAMEIAASITRYTPSLNSEHDFPAVGSVGASPDVQTLTMPEDIMTDAQSQLVLNVLLRNSNAYILLGAKVNYTYNAQIG